MNERNESVNEMIESFDEDIFAEVKPESVLIEAQRIIYGDREKTYGHPSKNLQTIAQMWTAYVNAASNNALKGLNFEPQDVAVMMIILKAARLANNPDHRDSIVDICGYAALIERCSE